MIGRHWRPLKVLIGCERSGQMRRAFEALGHDAWSCDLAPADDGSNRHIRGDLLAQLDGDWDLLAVMHPPCTILCNSGVRWLYRDGQPVPERWAALDDAAAFYRACRDAGSIPARAIENPIMHRHAIERTGRGDVQFVQPWWFGDPYFKATGFELVGLPHLIPTNRLVPPAKGTEEHKAWSRVHRMPPGPDRARLRSETFPGVAAACAAQWSAAVLEKEAAGAWGKAA